MSLVVLGEKGQVTVPRAVRKQLQLHGGDPLLLSVLPDGSIVLRPAQVYPVEIYTEERLNAFAQENRLSPAEQRRVTLALHGR